MKWLSVLFITVLVVISIAKPCFANEKFNLNKDNTSINFNASHLFLGQVIGKFDDFKGSFIIDSQYPKNNRADIIIKTESVDTGIITRNAYIRGSSLFNAALHPSMTFHSNKIEMGLENIGQITGNLTLLGITKPITLYFTREHGMNKNFGAGFKLIGKIKRSDFGMGTFFQPIGNKVTLLICYNMAECSTFDAYQEKDSKYNQ